MTYRKKAAATVAIVLGLLLQYGCDHADVVSGKKPEDRLNPSMSAQQRSAMIRHKTQNGDFATH
jgi:hypothetical protein